MDFSKERSLSYLRSAAQALFDENARLRQELARLQGRGDAATTLEQENAVLRDLLDRREQAIFGASTERRPRQRTDKGGPKPERAAQIGHGPREQPDLEVVEISHELPVEERVCASCGGELSPLGDEAEESELIGVTDRAFVREKHRRKKYRCGCNACVKTAPGPLRVVAGGRYTPAFAVEVAVAKYADHLPLERQAQIMRREGLRTDSQTLWDQLDALARHLTPTYEALIASILAEPVIGADETWWELLDNGKTKENKTFQAWGLAGPSAVAYRILDSRSKQAAGQVLGGYRGVVLADGYTVYQSLAAESGAFVVANCWAHVRRKFVEAEKNFPTEAVIAIDLIAGIYQVEREASKATDANRAPLRAEKSRPLVDKLMAWARETLPTVLPRSGIGEALAYMLRLEPGLRRFLDDARIPLDNNATERALRGVVLGRKNHYGSRSRRGTEVAAIMYTLMESAKLANVSPKAYLQALADTAIRTPGAVLTPGSFKVSLPPRPE